MELYAEFEEKGYRFQAYIPDGSAEGQAFQVKIRAGWMKKHTISIPMAWEPRFGVDAGDHAKLEAVTDAILDMLPPPAGFGKATKAEIDALVKRMTEPK